MIDRDMLDDRMGHRKLRITSRKHFNFKPKVKKIHDAPLAVVKPGLPPQQLPYPPAPFGACNQYDPDATQDSL